MMEAFKVDSRGGTRLSFFRGCFFRAWHLYRATGTGSASRFFPFFQRFSRAIFRALNGDGCVALFLRLIRFAVRKSAFKIVQSMNQERRRFRVTFSVNFASVFTANIKTVFNDIKVRINGFFHFRFIGNFFRSFLMHFMTRINSRATLFNAWRVANAPSIGILRNSVSTTSRL